MIQIFFYGEIVSKLILLFELGHDVIGEDVYSVALQGLHVVSQIVQQLPSFLSDLFRIVV